MALRSFGISEEQAKAVVDEFALSRSSGDWAANPVLLSTHHRRWRCPFLGRQSRGRALLQSIQLVPNPRPMCAVPEQLTHRLMLAEYSHKAQRISLRRNAGPERLFIRGNKFAAATHAPRRANA